MNLKATDFPALKAFALEKEIDMIVVGPEDPLVQGIFDSFKEDPATCHIDIIGPTAKGATLEGSTSPLPATRASPPTTCRRDSTSSLPSKRLTY